MKKTNPKPFVLLSLCICAKDGVISKTEEAKIFELINQNNKFKKLTKKNFEGLIIEFFSTNDQLEDYCNPFENEEDKALALEIAKQSATADGLEIKENIAYKKAENFMLNKNE